MAIGHPAKASNLGSKLTSAEASYWKIWVQKSEEWTSHECDTCRRQQTDAALPNNSIVTVAMRLVTCAVTQFACSGDKAANLAKAETLVRQAATAGAQIILLQELFEGLYWCQEQKAVRHGPAL